MTPNGVHFSFFLFTSHRQQAHDQIVEKLLSCNAGINLDWVVVLAEGVQGVANPQRAIT